MRSSRLRWTEFLGAERVWQDGCHPAGRLPNVARANWSPAGTRWRVAGCASATALYRSGSTSKQTACGRRDVGLEPICLGADRRPAGKAWQRRKVVPVAPASGATIRRGRGSTTERERMRRKGAGFDGSLLTQSSRVDLRQGSLLFFYNHQIGSRPSDAGGSTFGAIRRVSALFPQHPRPFPFVSAAEAGARNPPAAPRPGGG